MLAQTCARARCLRRQLAFRTRLFAAAAVSDALSSGSAGDSSLVLGIESSCDDTGVAIVRADGTVLGESLVTQEDVHRPWGGVVPKLAQEAHSLAIDDAVGRALTQARVAYSDLGAVAVTVGPGLSLCLKVGVTKAVQLSNEHRLPIIRCHHMEAHALVARLKNVTSVTFPFLCLLVSGGHNLLLLVCGVGSYVQLGTTVDDAIGEAFDKVARMLGLDGTHCGGALVEELARSGNPMAVPFTVPMANRATCDFSYSGLKTGVRLAVEAHLGSCCDGGPSMQQMRADIAASFQHVAVQQLVQRVRRAVQWLRADGLVDNVDAGESSEQLYASEAASDWITEEQGPAQDSSSSVGKVQCLVVAGGVAANATVRAALAELAAEAGLRMVCPPPRLCTDNGVMVAWAGHERMKLGLAEAPCSDEERFGAQHIDVRPRWPLTQELHPRCPLRKPLPTSKVPRKRSKIPHPALSSTAGTSPSDDSLP